MSRYRFPPISERARANGLNILTVPDHEQQTVVMALQFPGGRFGETAGREGAAELAVALAQKGTLDLDAEEFSERLERTGSQCFSDVGEEHVVIGCRFLSRFADSVVPLFRDMVVKPGMRGGELKRLKREMLTALDAERVEPSVLAVKHFHAQLFGSNHPAGRLSSVESVKRVSAGDVRAAWQRLAAPAGATLVWAGDLDAAATEAACGALFDSWQGRAEAAPVPTEAGPRPPGLNIRLVDKPDLTQTTLMIGHLLPGEEGPCRNELALANYILGGGNFSSRLMKEVRARLGGTYGISSQVSRVRRFGTLSISTSTINSRVREMLDTTLGVYRGVAEGGVTEEELSAAKRFVVGNMAFQLEGIGNVAEKLLWLRLYNRDTAYLENFADTISAIGCEAVNRAIREYFSVGNLVVSAVGKADAVRGQLAGLGALSEHHFRDPIR